MAAPTAGEHRAAIVRTADGSEIDLAGLVAELAQCDVVVLGEIHDNDAGHALQHDVVRALVDAGRDVAVSMEMFERDVQGALDDYLAGRITEAAFLAGSRPWKNYQQHYRPVVELARERGLPVLAANVPSAVARQVATSGEIPADHPAWRARSSAAPEDDYWRRFQATMAGHMGNDSAGALRRFYASQCLKDDTMAETVADWLDCHNHRPAVVVHLCGHFHSDFGDGTVARLRARRPLARIAVLSMRQRSEQPEKKEAADRDVAHYIAVVPGNSAAPAADPATAARPVDGEPDHPDENGDSGLPPS